jgi:hypothetical protein
MINEIDYSNAKDYTRLSTPKILRSLNRRSHEVMLSFDEVSKAQSYDVTYSVRNASSALNTINHTVNTANEWIKVQHDLLGTEGTVVSFTV